MAKEIETKKRKASVPESGAEKLKVKKVKKIVEPVEPVEPTPVAVKKRKAAVESADVPEVKKSKKVAKSTPAPEKITTKKVTKTVTPVEATDVESLPKKVTKKVTRVTKTVIEPEQEGEAEDAGGDEEDSEVDDQTQALLKGFESEDEGEDESSGEGLEEGAPVPEIKVTKAQKKALKKANEEAKGDKPGVVYVGRVPHGFYEHEMREYFGQFGTILKLRLSRNKATGASKHYAFIQFASSVVAEIVAKTMDNYLMFNHIMKVKLVAEEAVPADLWKGAGTRFKKIPRNRIEGRKLKLPATEQMWDERAEKLQAKRAAKATKLKEIGYEFELPEIKSAKGLAKKSEAPAAIEAPETETKAIEDAPAATEPTEAIEDVPAAAKSKKSKKKGKAATTEAESEETPAIAAETTVAKKASKSKKTKEPEPEIVEEVKTVTEVTEVTVEKVKKPRKAKKTA
ncbi:RNA-binding, RBD [Glarea lozoyensis ATCC 20868]|uniref:RNA-binding, RBD n=1 Tax=Glarea lozoyensis (strain ATCC 20868 / MF5171) TaxID=1116229 RepID=S3DFN5_GLAL2|nr:RNA-binding, RBD [Glarea lozoyensis ATCC 20868]EPE35944.1 RNA-binding, RBD [Glarea lozoyensis ATCC 20868]